MIHVTPGALAGRGSLVFAIALLAMALAACAPLADFGRTYINPVLDRDFPDPAVLRAPDGWHYTYATQGADARGSYNIQVARSRNLVDWEHLGDALPVKPAWSAKQAFWAPHVLHDAQRATYFMYYSAEPDDARGKCLAVATSSSPRGPFADSGAPLLCGQGIEHIDPMAFDDPHTGRRLLYWGSGRMPIKVQELAEDRLGFAPGSTPSDLLFPDDREYRSLIEGAWVRYRDGFYYLFYSGDRCCSKAPRYAVMVARARDALGPYEELAGTSGRPVIVEGTETWIAPGHNSVVTDDAGDDWILYHAFRANGPRARVMLLDRLEYRDGWPRLVGQRPSSRPQRAPRWRSRR
jgi:arabinan endo-1,5-alpha-L-arabinosidase